MFIDALKRQNPGLIEAAYRLWKAGAILPDSWVIDVDRVMENARLLLDVAHRHDIELYLMTKQIGRNPWLAEKLLALGYRGLVAVDYKEARVLRAHGLKVAHQGHLVQVPHGLVDSVVASEPEIITLFSLEKAQEIADAAHKQGREQAVMLKVFSEQDHLYPGQEAGFALSELESVIKSLRAMPGLRLAGLTHFPCLLWDETTQQTCTTPNLDTLLAARECLLQSGIDVGQLNAPSANSCTTLPILARYGITHAEPGHALTGTIPANQHGDQPERIAMLWISEISHHFNDTSYCYGGGYYRRGHARNALVITDDAASPVATTLKPVDSDSIDYHLPLEGLHPVSSAVIFCFRTQIFVTRSDVVLVSGIQRGAPAIEGYFDSLGNALPGPGQREA